MNPLFKDEFHAEIHPVPPGANRPRWSVLIPCYNCAAFLEIALQSVLSQDCGPSEMEILVVDDCSDRDDPGRVVNRLGRGRVKFIRQKTNIGKVRNYETGLSMCRGYLVHQLHGDDAVAPGFYREMDAAFRLFPEAKAFFCESEYINAEGQVTGRTGREKEETGILEGWLPRIVEAQRIQTPSMAVRREVYETLGGFDRRLDGNEDWEMWIRISHAYPVGFCADARAQYRTSAGNTSSILLRQGNFAQAQRNLFAIVDQYLPKTLVASARATRDLEQALYLSNHIPVVIDHGGFGAWRGLCREILRFCFSPFVLRRIASLTARHLWKRRFRLQRSGYQ